MARFSNLPSASTLSKTRRATLASRVTCALLVNASSVLWFACSSEPAVTPGSFSDTPAAVERSKAGDFEVTLYSSPTRVPVRGENHVRVALDLRQDEDVVVTPSLVTFMPAMGHGSGVSPKLTSVEDDRSYTFENVVLNMPGRWELRLTLESEHDDGTTKVDSAVFEFDVD